MSEKMKARDESFEKRSSELENKYKEINTRTDKLANFRGALAVAICICAGFYFAKGRIIWWGIACLAFFIFFLICVVRHNNLKNELRRVEALKKIHERYIARSKHDFEKLPEHGIELQPEKHSFAGDLDIFGEKSLFSLMCVAHTTYGKETLRDWLLAADGSELDVNTIKKRQVAAEELSGNLEMVEELEADTWMNVGKKGSPAALLAYIGSNYQPVSKVMVTIRVINTILLLGSFITGLILGGIMLFLPLAFLAVQFFLMSVSYKSNSVIFNLVEKFYPELRSYSNVFTSIESTSVESSYLNEIKARLYQVEKEEKEESASNQLTSLYKICLLIQARMQPLLYFLLNLVCPFDEYCIYLLEKWKKGAGTDIPVKLKAIGEWEAVMSIATLRFIYPDGCVPEILSSEIPVFEAQTMGHPLISEEKVVRNDFSLSKGCAMITGSNMSGKTTLLRTVGVNLVLAYAGAVCPTEKLRVSLMQIGASMRIEDNLGEGVSTFYAELIKIERIVRLSESGKPLLYLIDEIFRGTNSKDRTDGAWIVLKKLNRPSIIGLMSTHDYELCKMNDKNEVNLAYFHFSEYYDDEGLHFDYKLKSGMSTETNARYLMKLVGIEN